MSSDIGFIQWLKYWKVFFVADTFVSIPEKYSIWISIVDAKIENHGV